MGKNNNAIQILRGTRDAIANTSETLLPGQLLYNMTDNYITAGKAAADGNPEDTSVDSAPVTVRELHGWTGDANGIVDEASKGFEYGINGVTDSSSNINSLNIIGPGEISMYSGSNFNGICYTEPENSYTKLKLGQNITLNTRAGDITLQSNVGDINLNGDVHLKRDVYLDGHMRNTPNLWRNGLTKIDLTASARGGRYIFTHSDNSGTPISAGLYELKLRFYLKNTTVTTTNTTFLVSIPQRAIDYASGYKQFLASKVMQIDTICFTLGIFYTRNDSSSEFSIMTIDPFGFTHVASGEKLPVYVYDSLNGGVLKENSFELRSTSPIQLEMTALLSY